MKKYRITIMANYDGGAVLIFDSTTSYNPILCDGGLLQIISKIMPTIKWTLDDGRDITGTDYCQYVCYTEEDKSHYLLAIFDEE